MECFVVYRIEIDKRIDPYYYRPKYRFIDSGLKRTKYTITTLQEISTHISDGPGGWQLHVSDYVQEGVPLIRVVNLREEGIKEDNLVFITEEKHKQLKRSEVLNGDLLLSMRGTIGVATVVNWKYEKANINAAVCRIRLKKEINPKYVAIFLNSELGRLQTERGGFKAVQHDLNLPIIRGIKIILPPLETQNKIVRIMDNAYKLKKQRDDEAKQLLDSINDYVLSELGIKIPKLKDRMTFVAYANDIKGKRIDPYYYQPKFEEVEKAIEGGKFEVKELKDSFENGLIKGALPKNNEKNGEVKVLQIKNILKNGLIDTSEYLTAKNVFKQNQKIDKEEIIIVITGATIGKVGLWYSNEEFYLGGDMVKFKVNKRYNPYYIQAFLLSQAGQYQIIREITGATNKHLSPPDIENLKIPFPPLEIQNKIAEEVKRRKQKAKQLQKEAKEILEKAKKKVENIILKGEEL